MAAHATFGIATVLFGIVKCIMEGGNFHCKIGGDSDPDWGLGCRLKLCEAPRRRSLSVMT